jgi:hypothetical protein
VARDAAGGVGRDEEIIVVMGLGRRRSAGRRENDGSNPSCLPDAWLSVPYSELSSSGTSSLDMWTRPVRASI